MSDLAAESVGFGVIGANSFVANAAVLPAIAEARNAHLVATASRSGDVPEIWAATDVGSYEAVIDHPDVDAIYIPLPNGMHQQWTEQAAVAGKHVLCEKPLASDAATARAMAASCAEAGVFLAEAWMTPFHRRYQHVFELVEQGVIGTVDRVSTAFTFTIGPEAALNYRWDPTQGGGALLDVGTYCLGPVVRLFGAHPTEITASQVMTERGVDASTSAECRWADGRSASITCSFVDEEAQTLRIEGDAGVVSVATEAFTAGPHDHDISVLANETQQSVRVHNANDSYRSMIEAFADAVTGGPEWPHPAERSIEMLALIERIRDVAAT